MFGINFDIFVVGRVVRRLAVIGIHRPNEFFNAMIRAEYRVQNMFKLGSFYFVDTDEQSAVIGQELMKLFDAVVHQRAP